MDEKTLDKIERTGGCLCGKVRFRATGAPLRVGTCHCLDCRKASGAAFSVYGIWPSDAFEIRGDVMDYASRSFCPSCGGRVGWFGDEGEIEIALGSLDDAPSGLTPQYELWIGRREHWLVAAASAEQFDGDRIECGGTS